MNGLPKIHTGALVIASAIMFHAAIQATLAVTSGYTMHILACIFSWLGFVATVAFSIIACITGEVVSGSAQAHPARRTDGM